MVESTAFLEKFCIKCRSL